MRPLEGLVVVACEQAVAAPFATRQLADLGARVIKVERPVVGDFARDYDVTVRGLSSHFVWLNRSKESVTLDLKADDDVAKLHELLRHADVFIQNFAPGVADRLGFGHAALRDASPSLIVCDVSGYGDGGSMMHAKAYDALIQAEAGLISITGTADEPAKAGIPVADIAAGMYAFSAILAALFVRERTGEGAHLEISLFDSLVEWMGFPMYYTMYGGSAPVRAGTSHAAIAPYGVYAAGDGCQFILSVQNEREWHSFCRSVLQLEELAVDPRFDSVPRRVENRAQLEEVIAGVLDSVTGVEFESRLALARVAHARVRGINELLDHPQLGGRGRWTEVQTPVGAVAALLPAITWEGVAPRMDPVPGLGSSSIDAILEELSDRDVPMAHGSAAAQARADRR